MLSAPGAFEWQQELRLLNWTSIALAVAVFRESLSVANVLGLVLCLAGLWLATLR